MLILYPFFFSVSQRGALRIEAGEILTYEPRVIKDFEVSTKQVIRWERYQMSERQRKQLNCAFLELTTNLTERFVWK